MSSSDPRPPPDVLTITAAARLVGVSRRTIYNWIGRRLIDVIYTVSGNPRIVTASLATRPTKAPRSTQEHP